MKVKCPRCGTETEFSPDNPFRPFCSERCQLIDLGDWATEKFTIPVEDSGTVTELESGEESPNVDSDGASGKDG